ncbi:hypothetical protein MJ575_13890 [Klebsiella pneumoniae]|nr:hypothetical protein MJ575_13890 [Klebsiella pneumoniae]
MPVFDRSGDRQQGPLRRERLNHLQTPRQGGHKAGIALNGSLPLAANRLDACPFLFPIFAIDHILFLAKDNRCSDYRNYISMTP